MARLILRITGGPAAGKRFMLSAGQAAQIGSSDWADISLAADPGLAPVHFTVMSAPDGWRVRSAGDAALTINGKAASDVILQDGDELAAGSSVFAVQLEGAGPARPFEPSAAGEASSSRQGARDLAAPLADKAEISAEGRELLTDEQTPTEFIDALLQQDLLADAIRVQAAALAPAEAVRWACVCVRRSLGDSPAPGQVAAIEAAEKWADNPSEENRRACETAADSLSEESGATFAARAAFWSGDNMAPRGLPEVPIPPGLAIKGVMGALLLTASTAPAEQFDDTLRAFLEEGRSLSAASA